MSQNEFTQFAVKTINENRQQLDTKLSVNKLSLRKRDDGQLWAKVNGEETAVRINCCFPWSNPYEYISLIDRDDEEVALIYKLIDIDESSREVVKWALSESSFVIEVTSVISMKDEFEIRSWNVETKAGARRFQTKLDEWPQIIPGGGILIRDVCGDLFHFEKPETLDRKSQELISDLIS